jgi:hypothetical protein
MGFQPQDGAPSLPVADAESIWVRKAEVSEIDLLADLCVREVGPNTAHPNVIRRVMAFNSDGFFAVLHSQPQPLQAAIVGFYAYLLLNRAGVEALEADVFDALDPALAWLSPPHQRPAAVYGWSVVARGVNKWARPKVWAMMSEAGYADLDFYSRGVTDAGIRALTKLGCVPVKSGEVPAPGCLMVKRCVRATKAA